MKPLRWIAKSKGIILIILGVTIACTAFAPIALPNYDTIPPNTSLKCKVQDYKYHYAVSHDGEFYRLRVEDWVFLELPICGCEQ